MSERGHAAEADQQIEAEREDRCDQDLACEVDVEIAREQRQQQKQSGEQGVQIHLMRRRARTGPEGEMR